MPQAENYTGYSKATLWRMVFIVSALAFAVYLNSLPNEFVYDDVTLVKENTWIRGVKNIPRIFTNNSLAAEGADSYYYRPLIQTFHLICYQIFGLVPWGYRLLNIIMHALVSVLVLLTALKISGNGKEVPAGYPSYLSPPFIAAVLFAVHPIHTESVAWIAGITDVSCAFFYLLSLYMYMRAGSELAGRRAYWFSVFFFFLALLCKEPGITLPAVLICYDYVLKNNVRTLKAAVKRYVPYLAVAFVYLVVRQYVIRVDENTGSWHSYLTGYQHVLNIFPLFLQYMVKMALPVDLNIFHVFHPALTTFEAKSIISIILAAGVGVVTFAAWKKERQIFFTLVLAFLALLPALYIPVLGEAVMAERYMYLPSAGLLMAGSFSAGRALNKSNAAVSMALIAVICALFSTTTISRNEVWRNEYTLWKDSVAKSPDGAIPHYVFANALNDLERYDEAAEHYRAAVGMPPVSDMVKRGNIYLENGMPEKAAEQYDMAFKRQSFIGAMHYNYGLTLSRLGRTDEAIEHYSIAANIHPAAQTFCNLGNEYFKKGMMDKAIEQYKLALKLQPGHAGSHFNLGIAFEEKGWTEQAIQEYKRSLSVKPDYAEAHNNLGLLYARMGLMEEAVDHLRQAVKLDPTNVVCRENLSLAEKLLRQKH